VSKEKPKLFIIPEEPPINEHGLVIPPVPALCADVCNSCPNKNECFEDNHHLYWEANLYNTKLYKGLRSSPFIIKICRRVHDELHHFQLPPRKPTPEVARLAIAEAEIESRINTKYGSIAQKRSEAVRSKAKKTKRLESDIEKLLNEIDECKEQKSMLFGNAGGVLPTEKYYIVRNAEIEFAEQN
jgi:hypothetical protein